MTRSAREWFLILDDKLRVVGPRSYPDATSAIRAANHQAPWPTFQGRLVIRSDHAESGAKVGEGVGRVAATREKGRWSGSDVAAGHGYLVDPSLEAAHERKYNLPRTTKTRAQLQREIEEALGPQVKSMPKTPAQLNREIAQALNSPLPSAELERFRRLASRAVQWANPNTPFAAHTELRPYMRSVPKARIGEPVDRQFWLGEVLDDIRHDAERELSRAELSLYEDHVEQLLAGL